MQNMLKLFGTGHKKQNEDMKGENKMIKNFKKIMSDIRNTSSINKIEEFKQFKMTRRRSDFGGSHTVAIYPPIAALEKNTNPDPYDIAHGLDDPLDLNIYFHYAFCEWNCNFCYYIMRVEGASPEVEDNSVVGMADEIENWIESFKETRRNPEFVSGYIGGGTGLSMSLKSLSHLQKRLKSFTSEMNKPFNLCIETSSSALCRRDAMKKLDLLAECGLKRISIGVQTLDDEILRTQGRGKNRDEKYISALKKHPLSAKAIADHAVLVARKYVENINVDFMQDLSDRYTDETIAKDVEWFVSHDLPSLTLYVTRYKPGTRAHNVFVSSSDITPDFSHRSVTRRMAVQEVLRLAGYIDKPGGRFVKPGIRDIYKESRCSPVRRLLGIGPSAYSRLGSNFFMNETNIEEWLERVNQTGSGISYQHIIDDTESAEDELMSLLRCGGTISQFDECLPRTSDEEGFRSKIECLLNTGIIQKQDGDFKLTPLGRALEEEVVWLFYSEKNRQLSEKMYHLT